jgi:hypothetical protein
VDSLSGSGEAEFPPSPASFKAGSPFNEGRPPSFYSFDPRMGLSPYDDKSEFPDESLSPAPTFVVANRAPQELPRLGKSFRTLRLRNNADGPISPKTIITRTDSPVKPASVDVKSRRRQPDALYLNLLSPHSPPPLPLYTPYTPVSETGNKSPSASSSTSRRLPTIPKVTYGPRSMTSDSMYRAAPTSYTDPTAHSFPGTLRESHHVYPDLVQTTSPGVNSFHSATASIHSKWAVSPPYILPPPVLTPGVVHSSQLLRPTDPPSMYHAQTTTFKRNRNISEPNTAVENHGGDPSHRSYTLPVTEISLQRRGSDGQMVNHAEWRRLVLGAAAKP